MLGSFVWIGNMAFGLFALGIVSAVVAVTKVSAYYQKSGGYE